MIMIMIIILLLLLYVLLSLSLVIRLGATQTHPTPTHQIQSILNDLNCNAEESSVLRAFSELLHLINSNLNLLNGWWWGWGGFVWSQNTIV